jgi:A/G-specific adenine glycosylase
MSLIHIHHALHHWYRLHGRHHLPWRTTADPYAIYLSEVMLQQTQVATVLDRYYFPFLERFPTLDALKMAPEAEVLKYWEGLGYYTRARNLHKAARLAAPALPSTVEALMALPGIGRNTASAIAAFAFKLPVPVMEANVKRILYRVFSRETANEKELWAMAEHMLDRENPFDYNQAMMDLGAMICTPKNPGCMVCPLATVCKGRVNPQQFPAPRVKKKPPIVHKNIVVVVNRAAHYYVTKRTSRFLGGLHGFIECDREQRSITVQDTEYSLDDAQCVGHITQSYSHFKLEADVYQIQSEGVSESPDWVTAEVIATLPLSRADSKVLALIQGAYDASAK